MELFEENKVAAPPQGPQSSASPAAHHPSKKVKCNTSIDQGDETEVRALTTAKVGSFFAAHRHVTGADPLQECELSPEQISPMFDKVVSRDEEPYAEFSVLTMFGRRMQKTAGCAHGCCMKMGHTNPSGSLAPPKAKKAIRNAVTAEIGQCTYGVESRRPTTFKTNVEWMAHAARRCEDVPEHPHEVLRGAVRTRPPAGRRWFDVENHSGGGVP